MDKDFVRHFFKSSAVVTVTAITSMAFHFVSITILARQLSRIDLGIYVLVVLIAGLLGKLCGFGMDLAIVHFISDDTEPQKNTIVWPIVQMRLIGLLLIGVIFYFCNRIFLSFFDARLFKFSMLIFVLSICFNFRDLFYNLLQGLHLFRRYSALNFFSAALRFALIGYFLVVRQLDLAVLIYIEIATASLTMLCQLATIPFIVFKGFYFSPQANSKLFKFSYPIYFNDILTFIYDNISVFVIGILMNPVSVAYYDIARKIPTALMKIFHSFIVVYFPNASKLFARGNKKEARDLMNQSLVFSYSCMIFAAAACFLFQKEFMVLFFSEKYLGASMAFALLVLNFNLRVVSNLMGYTLVSAGMSSAPVKVNIIACSASVISSVLLIPKLGIIGAVCSLLIMNTISQTLYYRHLLRTGVRAETAKFVKLIAVYAVCMGSFRLISDPSFTAKILTLLLFSGLSGFVLKDEFNFLIAGSHMLVNKIRGNS